MKKRWKSTTLGLAMIIFSSLLIYKNITLDYWINGLLYFVGMMLFFTGDSFIIKLEDVILSFFKKKINNNKNGECE